MATRFGRRWPHGPKNVRYVLSRGEPTERTPLGNSYGPWSVRAIKRYGLVALDEPSNIEVGLTKNSVVFDDEFQWFTETRRGIVTLFDNDERQSHKRPSCRSQLLPTQVSFCSIWNAARRRSAYAG